MKYKSFVFENTWVPRSELFHFGWGNGYVAIPQEHPFYGLHYDIINHYVKIHGGLTHSSYCDEEDVHRYGLETSDVGKWIIGFDTAHSSDNEDNWSRGAVLAETDYLLTQVIGFSHLSKEEILNNQNA